MRRGRKLREWGGDGTTGCCCGFSLGAPGRQSGLRRHLGARSTYRNYIRSPDYCFFNVGFRPARSSVP